MASGADYDADLWRRMVELGWSSISLPDSAGGMGLGLLELCVLAEEAGRALPPVPFINTVCLAAELLRRCENTAAAELLAKIATGDAIVACALQGTSTGRIDVHGEVTAGCSPVADAAFATHLLTRVRNGGGREALVAVDLAHAGVARERCARSGLDDLAPYGAILLTNVPAVLLAEGATAHSLVEKVMLQAAVLTAFMQIGGAEAALEAARDYSLQRFTFGRAIGSYQAIKHKLADILVEIEIARSNAFYGAWAMSTDSPELPQAAALARLSATDAFVRAAEESLHVHGGIGYTWEADCHFYYRRARLLAVSLGDTGDWAERLVATI
jgi:alkylation response protein AidB-like acyl-CoA dehydrogenase